MLPHELALHVLTFIGPSHLPPHSSPTSLYLNSSVSPARTSAIINEANSGHHEALETLLSCRLVSRTWCRLASDNAVWRALFLNRWGIDLRRTSDPTFRDEYFRRSIRATLGKTWDYDLIDIGEKAKRVLGLSVSTNDVPIFAAPLRLDWRLLYYERVELERRWSGTPCTPPRELLRIGSKRVADIFDVSTTIKGSQSQRQPYNPKPMRITGHTDR